MIRLRVCSIMVSILIDPGVKATQPIVHSTAKQKENMQSSNAACMLRVTVCWQLSFCQIIVYSLQKSLKQSPFHVVHFVHCVVVLDFCTSATGLLWLGF